MPAPIVEHRPPRRARGSTRKRTALLGLVLLVCMLVPLAAAAAQETTTTPGSPEATATQGSTTATGTPGSSTATGTPGLAQPGLTTGPAEFSALNQGISLAEQVVTVLPEYDSTTTEVLVFVDVTVPDSVPLPVTFKFVVPGNARVTGFAQVDPQGGYDYNRPNPQFSTQGDYTVVTVQAPTYRQLHLEYYYAPGPGMPEEGEKSFAVVYTVPADTQTLYIYTQEPKRAEGFTVEPAGQVGEVASDGYRYAQNIFSGVKAGSQATLTVSYTKNDADTSEAAVGGPTEEQSTGASWLLWILIAVVAGILGFVAYRIFAGRRSASSGGRSPAGGGRSGQRSKGGGQGGGAKGGTPGSGKSVAAKSASSEGTGGPPNRFCTQCGARLTKKDRFCPECGHERES